MTLLVGLPFAGTFIFSRTIAADCRDATGAVVTRAANVARFDHDIAGLPLGLIVAPGEAVNQHDAVSVPIGDWTDGVLTSTVLHEYEIDGAITRRAIHTTKVRATVNACLAIAARHRFIGVVPVFLPNLGNDNLTGFVRFRAIAYPLGQALGDGAGHAIGDSAGRPLIES